MGFFEELYMRMAYMTIALAMAGAAAGTMAVADETTATPAAEKQNALSFTVKDIDGKDVNLTSYKGKVILMLNVASKCGNTPQYAGLEKLYAKYKNQGLVVMGFPANNFGGQEPGSNAEIKEFCAATYQVDFPMFAKVSVKGADQAPLFKFLTAQECKPLSKGDIAWNFEKFLVDRNGNLIGRFGNKVQPDDAGLVGAIEGALK
jgi:glutathione peroxidase